jgi:hypothetical protein
MQQGTGVKNGGGAGTRTPDTGIMIPLLYQLSYTAPGSPETSGGKILYPADFVKKKCEERRILDTVPAIYEQRSKRP